MRLLSGLTRLYKVAFPDKKAKLYVFLFIALLSLFVLWVISIPLSYLFSSIFFVLVFSAVLFVGFSDYYYYLLFFRKKRDLDRKGVPFEAGVCKVRVFCSDYEVKPLMKSYKVGVTGAEYDISCKFLKGEDFFLLYLQKKAWVGIYTRDIGVIDLSNVHDHSSFKGMQFLECSEGLLISFSKPKSGVDKILVYDFYGLSD